MQEIQNLETEEAGGFTPTTEIAGFQVRPGFFLINGAVPCRGGVSFTIHSFSATACVLHLFHRGEEVAYADIPFPASFRIGNTFSMIIFGLDIHEFTYTYSFDGPYDPARGLLFSAEKQLLDPYARAVTGQSVWGRKSSQERFYQARVVDTSYDWGEEVQPQLPFSELVIYEMHVRGFTRDASSKVAHPGTFAGIQEKIPYLKQLGVNALELMPVFEFDEMGDSRVVNGTRLYNYWGYNTVGFFAPNTSYTSALEYNHEGTEFKNLIRQLHHNGIEVILDVVFNHTAEGNENGPFFSFKGIDNNIYYMLAPDGTYYNFSGCGNVLNCNHPVVQQFILECLRYWVTEYRVDGFRFDLASILGRNEDGSPMEKPPLLESLAFDPVLGGVKLIAEAWDAGGLYQVGTFPSWNRWAEWNGRYRDQMRCFLKGDGGGMAQQALERMTGSRDIYDPAVRGLSASVNFLTCHDGFPLYDLYAYNQKHNEANGWNNSDGMNDNNSWNCGAEGETADPQIRRLRLKMCMNAFGALLCSRGPVHFLAGDEFCNTQYGNNNAYCQDNAVSWLEWTRCEQYSAMLEFASYMIHFRREHPVLCRPDATQRWDFPDVSFHTDRAWQTSIPQECHTIGVMFTGKEDCIYVGLNAYWEAVPVQLPQLPAGFYWEQQADTGAEDVLCPKRLQGEQITLEPRSFFLAVAKEQKR